MKGGEKMYKTIRISTEAYEILKRLSEANSRTLKATLDLILKEIGENGDD